MLVIWYVDAGNTSHSTLSNHLSLLNTAALHCPYLKIGRYASGCAQKAQQSSDIVNKNQLLMINFSPGAVYVVDLCYKSHEQHLYGGPLCSFCRFSLLMHVPSLHLLPTWTTRACLTSSPSSTIIFQIGFFHY